MLQRIQSIFLALVIVIFTLLFFIPVYAIKIIKGTTPLALFNIPILLILIGGISILALIVIFSYKNRKRQISLCKSGVIVSTLISIDAIFFPQFLLHGIDVSVLQLEIGSYLLPVNIILFALAARSIKKDDDLVKAADRLR